MKLKIDLRKKRHRVPLTVLVIVVIALLFLVKEDNRLEQIQKAGELVVVTRNSPTTYYEGAEGKTGLDYDLLKRFAKHLKVNLKLVTENNIQKMLNMVTTHEVDFAAAGLTVTEERKKIVSFSEPYQSVRQQVIYRVGSTGRPKKPDDLIGHDLEIVGGSSHAERLEELQKQYPELEWTDNFELSSEELLQLVWQQVVEYTVADSNEFKINQRFYPELRVGFNLTDPQELAWAFPIDDDKSLYNASVSFIKALKSTGELELLLEKYYGHIRGFDYVGTRAFVLHILERLPLYRNYFETAAEEYDWDWKLLAAIGYQESHWNPDARSPTGVKGIMMLTLPTAELLDIEDRTNPEASILGGARFLRNLKKRVPERIREPDRTWMTLAAYNVGYGHLNDARIITQKRGGDADLWNDVKENLPLLSRAKWYKNTKHGYARGWEPVRYVENIRSYYEVLTWYLEQQQPEESIPEALKIEPPAL